MKDEEVNATWNYRLFKGDENNLSIHEVYYHQGEPSLYTENPVAPFGESVDEIKEDLEKMLLSFNKPILTEKDFD